MTQPAASRAIAALERLCGAQLLQRSTRRLALTEAGARAYERARALLEEADGLDAEIRGLAREPIGLLRLSASVAHAGSEIVPHLPAFLAAYPRIRVDLATSDARIDLVEEGVDLAFRLGELSDSTLTVRPLGHYQRVLVVAPALSARLGPIADLDQLASAPCVWFSGQLGRSRQWRLSDGKTTVEVAIDGPVSAASGWAMRDLALQGLGIALAPSFLVERDLASGALAPVLSEWRGEPLALSALWASGRALPQKARALLDFVGPRFRTT